MTERSRDFLVGLASLGGLLGLAVLLLMFGELDGLVHPRYVLTIDTERAAGLRSGSSVELNGVPIGVIDAVVVRDHEAEPVRITALIDHDVRIPVGALPYAATNLLGGAAILEMEFGRTPATSYLPRDDTATIVATIRYRMIEQIAAELDSRMEPLMLALGRFDELSTTYTELGRNLNELLEPSDGAPAAGDVPNLGDAVARLYDVLDTTEEAVALAREWLADEQLRTDARSALAKADALLDRADGTLRTIGDTATALRADASTLESRLSRVADELAAALEDVRGLARTARDGTGTVALLLNSPDLYRNLEATSAQLEQTLRETRLLIQKIAAEGMPLDVVP